MYTDRRQFEREPVIVEIEPKGKHPEKYYRLVDISKSGFKLDTDHYMTEGERFDFTFRLTEGERTCRLPGQVVWVDQISPVPARYRIGLAFPQPLEKLPEVFTLPLTEEEKKRLG